MSRVKNRDERASADGAEVVSSPGGVLAAVPERPCALTAEEKATFDRLEGPDFVTRLVNGEVEAALRRRGVI